jgi:hypothetical protein
MKKLLKTFSITVALCIVLSMCATAYASQANELKGHWAEKTLTEWVQLGLLKGDNNGNYNPDSKITRAEFMVLVNRVMRYTAKSDSIRKFADVSTNKWYYDDASKALAAGYITGTSANTLSPEDTITREQAITIISRINGIDPNGDTGILLQIADSPVIAGWAKGPVAGAIREGLVTGSNGRINPKANTTRSEAIVLLDRVRTDTRVYYFAGTYGPESGTAAAGNVVIASPRIKLRNIIVAGDLEIADAVGEGEATLENVVVRGKIVAKGGSPKIVAGAIGGDGGSNGGDNGDGGRTPSGGGNGGSNDNGGNNSGGGGNDDGGGNEDDGNDGGGNDDDDDLPVLVSITIASPPSKLTYEIGEPLDLTGLVVTGTYPDNTTKTETVSMSNISGYDSGTAGEKTVTVTINGKTAKFKVDVNTSENVVITSINAIADTVEQNDTYTLPAKVTVNISNGKTAQLAVVWSPSAASTDQYGEFSFDGTVAETAGIKNPQAIKATLTLTVKPVGSQGTIINAASCKYEDVSEAVSKANSGDTILVPEGTATWDQTLLITSGITLKSKAGAENTIINGGMGIDQYIIQYEPSSPSEDPLFRLSGFTFDADDAALSLRVSNQDIVPITIRIDHNRFIDCTQEHTGNNRAPFIFSGTVYGVVDNNEFSGDVHIDNMGLNKRSWENGAFQYGTTDNLYYEDNVFTSSSVLDSGGHGGRYCNRYNTYNLTKNVFPMFDAHGNQLDGVYTTMGVEIYGNLVRSKGGDFIPQPLLGLRGGKALAFFNRIETTRSVKISVREEWPDEISPPVLNPIDGTPQRINNSYFWNNRNTDSKLVSVESDINIGNKPAEAWQPNFDYASSIYYMIPANDSRGHCWKVRTRKGSVPYLTGSTEPDWNSKQPGETIQDGEYTWINLGIVTPIAENESYWIHSESFTGETGVGCGHLADRPATCIPGVAYWATDQDCSEVSPDNVGAHPKTPIAGTLYKCTAPNTWVEYYTPYTYPHPLRTSGPLADSGAKNEDRTWYVDNAAAGKNDGTSWSDAWKSFVDINWGKIAPGDQIAISGGTNSKTYYEQLKVGASGEEDKPITIVPGEDKGHNGTVIISYDNGHNPENNGHGINISGKNHISVIGAAKGEEPRIRITGCSDAGVYLNGLSHHIQIFGLEIDNNGDGYANGKPDELVTPYMDDGIYTNFSSKVNESPVVEIAFCKIHDNYQDQITLAAGRGKKEYGRFLIHDNEIYNINDDGVETGDSQGVDIYNNIFHTLVTNGGDGHPDGIQTAGGYQRIWNNTLYDFYNPDKVSNAYILCSFRNSVGEPESHILVYNNLIYHDAPPQERNYIRGIEFTKGNGNVSGISDVYIANNTIIGTPFHGLSVVTGDNIPGENVSNINIYNNLIINCHRLKSTGPALMINSKNCTIGSIDSDAHIKFDNNIIFAGEHGTCIVTEEKEKKIYYMTNEEWTAATGCNKNIIGNPDPLLTSDYRLKVGSPAIGKGIDLSHIFDYDITGAPRGNEWDIGAYEN